MMKSADIVYQKLTGSYAPTAQECEFANTRIDKYNCVCNHLDCKDLMEQLAHLSPDKARWVKFPSTKRVLTRSDRKIKEFHDNRRQKFIDELGSICMDVTKFEENLNEESRLAMHHFHPEIINTTRNVETWKCEGWIPTSIPGEVAVNISYPLDLASEDGKTYMTIPNYPFSLVRKDIEILAAAASVENRYQPTKKQLMLAQLFRNEPKVASVRLSTVLEEHDALTLLNNSKIKPAETSHDGLSRENLLDPDWHDKHKNAARHYFGFSDWKETKGYIKALFDLDPPPLPFKNHEAKQFEKMLAVKMLIVRNLSNELVADVWGVGISSITRWISAYLPLWGEAGLDNHIIDMNQDFIDADMAPAYHGELRHVYALDDGKDIETDTFRKDTLFTQAQFSHKVKHAGVRYIAWTTPGGLAFEATFLGLARPDESAFVKLWGTSHEYTPLRNNSTVDIPNLSSVDLVAQQEPVRDGARQPDTISLLRDLERVEQDRNASEGLDEDEVDQEDARGDDEDNLENDVKELLEWFETRVSVDDGQPPVLSARNASIKHTVENFHEACKDLLHGGPDSSATRKIKQLTRHNRLHAMYESGQLKKCHFSFYLHFMADTRAKLLEGLLGNDPIGERLRLPTRLLKIPPDALVLSDRGFAEDAILYPNINGHLTPAFVGGRPQFEVEEVHGDKDLKKLRYTSEVFFARVTNTTILKDSVPYNRLHLLEDALNWANGAANLYKPLRPSEAYKAYVGNDAEIDMQEE